MGPYTYRRLDAAQIKAARPDHEWMWEVEIRPS